MANIKLEGLRHSYVDNPKNDEDWALKQIDLEWEDGGAYALLGPSGCGKTTLLFLVFFNPAMAVLSLMTQKSIKYRLTNAILHKFFSFL